MNTERAQPPERGAQLTVCSHPLTSPGDSLWSCEVHLHGRHVALRTGRAASTSPLRAALTGLSTALSFVPPSTQIQLQLSDVRLAGLLSPGARSRDPGFQSDLVALHAQLTSNQQQLTLQVVHGSGAHARLAAHARHLRRSMTP